MIIGSEICGSFLAILCILGRTSELFVYKSIFFHHLFLGHNSVRFYLKQKAGIAQQSV